MAWFDDANLQKEVGQNGYRLLDFFQRAEWWALERFAVQKNIFITLITAILGAGFVAVSRDEWILVASTVLVPVIVAMAAQFALETLDRYYARFLEAVVVQRKLRFILGIGADTDPPYPRDEHLEVARRGPRTSSSEGGGGDDSRTWVTQRMGDGHNRVAWQILFSMFVASLVPPLVGAARFALGGLAPSQLPAGSDLGFEAILFATISTGVAIAVFGQATRRVLIRRSESYGVGRASTRPGGLPR